MKSPMLSTGIRLEGTQKQLDEALLRLSLVFTINDPKIYSSRDHPDLKLCYLRAYTYKHENLSDRLNYCQQDNQRLQEELGEMSLEVYRLRKQLGWQYPKPDVWPSQNQGVSE